jgi:hypothetical protein
MSITYDERTLFNGECSFYYHKWSDGTLDGAYAARRHISNFPPSWQWQISDGSSWIYLVKPSTRAAVTYLTKQRNFIDTDDR